MKKKLKLKVDTIRKLMISDMKLIQGANQIDGSSRDWTCDVCDASMPAVCPM